MKQTIDIFRKSSTPDEKAPFAKSATFAEHGSINKDKESNMTGTSSIPYRRPSDPKLEACDAIEDEEKPPMGFFRKLLFFLSLNSGVAYVAVLLWVIPCRHPLCPWQQKEWQTNLSVALTSNMATTKYTADRASSVIFGYSDDSGGHLGALSMSDGSAVWNRSSEHTVRHVFCRFELPVETCIVTAYGYIGAFDAATGKMLWERNITEPADVTIHRVMVTGKPPGEVYILGVSDAYLFTMNTRNGSGMSAIALPCTWTIEIKLVGPWVTRNGTLWTLVCEYGDSVELWTFQEEQMLKSLRKQGKAPIRDDVEFNLIFSPKSGSGSINLAGDVTRTEDSLAFSWTNIVVMVTNQALTHRLEKSWERSFKGPNLTFPVTSINFGHFTDMKVNQIAVTVQQGEYTTVHILDTKNGSSVTTTSLGMKSVLSAETMTGAKGDTDILVFESVHQMIPIKMSNSSEDSSRQIPRHYFTMQYTKTGVVYQNLISSEVYASTLSSSAEGFADLLIANQSPDGDTSVKRLVVARTRTCDNKQNRNTTSTMLDL